MIYFYISIFLYFYISIFLYFYIYIFIYFSVINSSVIKLGRDFNTKFLQLPIVFVISLQKKKRKKKEEK